MSEISLLHSPSAEIAVLGTMLAHPNEVIDEVTAILSKEDFFSPANREIFGALIALHGKSEVGAMTVHQWLTDRKMAEACGSPGILGDMLNGFATHLNVSSYVSIVLEKSRLRRLRAVCLEIVEDIVSMPDSVPEVIGRAEKAILEVCEVRQDALLCNASALTSHFEAYLGQIDRGERSAAVKTGYECIDRINGGLKPGGMHVIGGRSGLGKTTLMLNLTENLCKNGVGVGIISLEMDRLELASAIYSYMADINSRKFKDKMTAEEWEMVRWASDKIRQWKLQIDDCSLLDIHALRHKARKMVKEGAQVLVIDYLQLLDDSCGENKKRSRAEAVAEMSRSIKLLGKELTIPIIVGAQLNRQAATGEPGLHQLRESGAIEQDADVVILLRQKDESDKGARPVIIWNLAKWRGGQANVDLEFVFDKTRQRFHEMMMR